jgi:hypothetical protein
VLLRAIAISLALSFAKGQAMPEPWEVITPRWSSGSLPARSSQVYEQILAQFDVEHASRYAPKSGITFCNIFVWDATKALGCELPHWWYRDELSANGLSDWLTKYGANHGWMKVDSDHARQRANAGFPVVAVWKNPGAGSGHIAMVRPSGEEGQLHIAQAGASNHADIPITTGFGLLPVTLWSHD